MSFEFGDQILSTEWSDHMEAMRRYYRVHHTGDLTARTSAFDDPIWENPEIEDPTPPDEYTTQLIDEVERTPNVNVEDYTEEEARAAHENVSLALSGEDTSKYDVVFPEEQAQGQLVPMETGLAPSDFAAAEEAEDLPMAQGIATVSDDVGIATEMGIAMGGAIGGFIDNLESQIDVENARTAVNDELTPAVQQTFEDYNQASINAIHPWQVTNAKSDFDARTTQIKNWTSTEQTKLSNYSTDSAIVATARGLGYTMSTAMFGPLGTLAYGMADMTVGNVFRPDFSVDDLDVSKTQGQHVETYGTFITPGSNDTPTDVMQASTE